MCVGGWGDAVSVASSSSRSPSPSGVGRPRPPSAAARPAAAQAIGGPCGGHLSAAAGVSAPDVLVFGAGELLKAQKERYFEAEYCEALAEKQRTSDEGSAKRCSEKEFDVVDTAVDPQGCIMPSGLNALGHGTSGRRMVCRLARAWAGSHRAAAARRAMTLRSGGGCST